jgi:transposase-like protein
VTAVGLPFLRRLRRDALDPPAIYVLIRKLRAENFQLRRANEILKSASVFFAKELDEDRTR